MSDVLLSGGSLVDGTKAVPRTCNVLICGDQFADIGSIPNDLGVETIDCTGLVVAPGFIDVHSHSDYEVLQHFSNKVLQGVTTEIVGNCGFSLFPAKPTETQHRLTDDIFQGEAIPRLGSAATYFDTLQQARPLLNVAALTGHATLRSYVAEARANVTEDEMQTMERLLEECLESGSIGLSTGLNCMPSGFARFDELVRLCRLLRPKNAFYTTHMRDYKFKVVEAVDEAIAVARASDAPLQISHMQVVGQKNWHRLPIAMDHIERARARGLDIAMDAYPYLAGSCSIIQLLPEWSQVGGIPELLNRLANRSNYDRIARETDEYMSNTWDDIVVCELPSPRNKSVTGKSIARIAAERGAGNAETALDLLLEERGQVFIISFNNNEENLRTVLTHPLTSVITDGLVMQGISHPRTFGTYPKFLGEYVRDKQWLSLPEAIFKTSGLAASRFRLHRRGTIKAGNFADAVIFDPERIGTRSDYANPAQDPEGIRHVLVNGRFAVRNGKLTSESPGGVLRCAA
jgi:dihydroorotase/N-acyl-D-amino-acid deacylase